MPLNKWQSVQSVMEKKMKLFKWLVGPVALCIFVGNQGCTNKTANEAELVASKSDPDSANRNTANDESALIRSSQDPPKLTSRLR